MQTPSVERRLVAILAADVVGYSRLMEVDEAGTLARLKTHRLELVDPAIAKNRGRIIKTTGDGLLVEFHSVVDAVQCAAEIQQRMARRNADVSAARALQFRIGINLGDVIVEGMTSSAKASTSPRASRGSPSPAGFTFRRPSGTRWATGSTSASRTSVNSGSRTS
jgi:class 3 adenylate cyclase